MFRLGASQLGPGPGAWLVEAPGVHGLSAAKLGVASQRHASELDQRDCLLVVKDGVIVHESYREGGDLDTLHYVDGVGATAAALLIGAAARQGILDLDAPLADYGIAAPAVRDSTNPFTATSTDPTLDAEQLKRHPELRWGNEWSRVTARHVLAGVTGLGEAPAGMECTEDATGSILQVLSKVLKATTGVKPVDWAKEHFTGPLGVSDFFAKDLLKDGDDVGGVNIAGGQMATCRDAARFGQLMVNGGTWLDENGEVTRLVDSDFIGRLTASSLPNANANAGYATRTHPGKTSDGLPRATAFFAGVSVSDSSPKGTKKSRKEMQVAGEGKKESTSVKSKKEKKSIQAKVDSEIDEEAIRLVDAAKVFEDEHAKAHPTGTDNAVEPSLGAAPETAETHRAPTWVDYEVSGGNEENACGESSSSILGPDGPSFPLAFSVGKLGKFLVVSPETQTVVVSMGNTWGSSDACPSGLRELLDEQTKIAERARAVSSLGAVPNRGAANAGYDERVLMRQLWVAVGDAVTPVQLLHDSYIFGQARSDVSGISRRRASIDEEGQETTKDGDIVELANPTTYAKTKASAIAAVAATGATEEVLAEESETRADDYEQQTAEEAATAVSALASSSRQDALASAKREQATRLAQATHAEEAARIRRRVVDESGKLGSDIDADPSGGRTGACRCACAPALDGVGQCVNMRGVPEASCGDAALLGGAKGYCPALGVTSTCAVPVEKTEKLGKPKSSKHSGKHRHLLKDVEEDEAESQMQTTSVKISAARFSDADVATVGFPSSGSVSVTPETPAFECANTRACAPGLGSSHTESFLCQPLTFVSCTWSDELCDQRSPRDATRRATTKHEHEPEVAGSSSLGHTTSSKLVLSEPSVETYLGLTASNVAGATTPSRETIGVVSTGRWALAAAALSVTAFVAVGSRVARAAAAERERTGRGEKTRLLGVEVKVQKCEVQKGDVKAKAAVAVKTVPTVSTPSTVSTPEPKVPPVTCTLSAGKPPLPPRPVVTAPIVPPVTDTRHVELGEAPESEGDSSDDEVSDSPRSKDTPRSQNTDDEIDAWLNA